MVLAVAAWYYFLLRPLTASTFFVAFVCPHLHPGCCRFTLVESRCLRQSAFCSTSLDGIVVGSYSVQPAWWCLLLVLLVMVGRLLDLDGFFCEHDGYIFDVVSSCCIFYYISCGAFTEVVLNSCFPLPRLLLVIFSSVQEGLPSYTMVAVTLPPMLARII